MAGCSEVNSSMEPASAVLPEVIIGNNSLHKETEIITTFVSEDNNVPSLKIQKRCDSEISQVVEINPAHFELVTAEGSSGVAV